MVMTIAAMVVAIKIRIMIMIFRVIQTMIRK